MQVIEYPTEETFVAIRNDDWLLINKAIADAVAPLNPRGWRKALFLLREWGVLGTIATIIVGLLAISVGAIYQATARIEKETKFQTETEDTLKGIREDIKEIKTGLTKQSLGAQATLPLAQFKTALPDIHSSITAAKQQNLKVPATVVEDIARKMAGTDTNAPAFWPTAAAVISYQSSLLVGSSGNWSVTLPTCRGTVDLLGADKNATVQGSEDGKLTGPKFPIQRVGNQDCYVELDGKTVSKWDCMRCLVKYSGGPVSLTDVHFEDCLFLFDFSSKPATRDGERLTEALLASKSQSVRLA